jgi:hypothetical protein
MNIFCLFLKKIDSVLESNLFFHMFDIRKPQDLSVARGLLAQEVSLETLVLCLLE